MTQAQLAEDAKPPAQRVLHAKRPRERMTSRRAAFIAHHDHAGRRYILCSRALGSVMNVAWTDIQGQVLLSIHKEQCAESETYLPQIAGFTQNYARIDSKAKASLDNCVIDGVP